MEFIKCVIFGSISKVKGYERAIEVIERNPKIFLTVAGPLWNPLEQPTLDYLKEKEKNLKNLKIEARFLEEDEFEKYSKKADVIVLPYWSVVPASGVLPRILKYMKPIVTWDTPDFRTYEKKYGACVTANSVEELEKKIIEVFKSSKLRNNLKKGAKKLLNECSWENIAKEHSRVYGDVINFKMTERFLPNG